MGMTLIVLGLLGPAVCVLMKVNYNSSCGILIRNAGKTSDAQVAKGYLAGAVYYMEEHGLDEAQEDGIGEYCAFIRAQRDSLQQGTRLEDVQAALAERKPPMLIAQWPRQQGNLVLLCFGIFFFLVGLCILNCEDIDRGGVI